MRGGGSERQVALLANHLPRDQFDVHLYLTHRAGELLAELPLDVTLHSPAEVPTSSVRKILDRFPGAILRRQAVAFADVVRRERIDVVYDRAFHNTLIAGHPAIQNRHIRRVSTIVSPPRDALPMVEKRFVNAKRRRLANAYRRSAHVVAVSQAAADSAADYYGLPQNRIVVIRNPVDIESVRRVAGWAGPRSEKTEADPLQMVCVGRMTPEKGQSDLIAAMSRLPGWWPPSLPRVSLRMIGDGPDRVRLERQWAAIVESTGGCDGHTVEFCGTITPALAEIARADALVLPSHFEGLPNVVLEAFALQVPVIATASGGTTELQADPQHPTCFWAAASNPDSLASALRSLAENSRQRAVHVQAADRLVQQRHALATSINPLSELLLG